jgi:phosphoglucosamine mutase
MRAGGFNLGGEQSGHIVMTDHATTGDGLLAALQVLHAVTETGQSASALTRQFDPVPQVLRNVRYAPGQSPMTAATVLAAVRQAEARLNSQGRLLIRKSGTEPLVRVMAECEDPALLRDILDTLVAEIEAAL